MSTTTKTLPACDCLNDCGDDPAIKSGKAAACDKLKERREQDQQRALAFVRVNLIMQQYGVTTVYDLVEHLHTKVEQLPTNIDPRWADIDFDKVNAELRDLRDQVGRLQAHIDRTQPVQANAEGYVQPNAQGEAVYLVATGETHNGEETYTRHDVMPPLCEAEKLCIPLKATEPAALEATNG